MSPEGHPQASSQERPREGLREAAQRMIDEENRARIDRLYVFGAAATVVVAGAYLVYRALRDQAEE